MTAAASETTAIWFLDSLAEPRVSSDEGDGRLSAIEMTVPAGAMTPLHVDDADESFYVLEGEVTFYAGDEVSTLERGASFLAPRGVPHTYRPETDLRMLVVTDGGFERFVRSVGRPAEFLAPPPALDAPPSPEVLDSVSREAARNGIEILGPPGMVPTDL